MTTLCKSRRRYQRAIVANFVRNLDNFQKDSLKHKSWFKKKGELNAHVYFESNLTEVPRNTWWIDSRCTIHVSNTMLGFLTIQTIRP